MKNFFIGVLVASLLWQTAANALEVKLEDITIRDLFAGLALCGLLSNDEPLDSSIDQSFKAADKMLQRRKQRVQ